jgi:hypothetical protein
MLLDRPPCLASLAAHQPRPHRRALDVEVQSRQVEVGNELLEDPSVLAPLRHEPVGLVEPGDAFRVEQAGEDPLGVVREAHVLAARHALILPRSEPGLMRIPPRIPWSRAAGVSNMCAMATPAAERGPESGAALVKELLTLAQGYVREGWCQGSHALDASGRPVLPASAFARSWSAPGALERAWSWSENRFDRALEAFEHANLALAAAAGDVPQVWNDAAGRTIQDVLDIFTTAIEDVGGAPGAALDSPPKVGSAPH